MRVFVAMLCGFVVIGCAGPKVEKGVATENPGKPVVMPDFRPTGKIAMVNREGRFVVMTFPIGMVPGKDKKLSVYHQGLKVGEVKVNAWSQDLNAVGDLIAGEAHVNDEVREN